MAQPPILPSEVGGDFGDFGDFGVSFVATVAGRYTRWGGPGLSVQGEPLLVPTRETMRYHLCNAAPQ
jgi:hypothetical protein